MSNNHNPEGVPLSAAPRRGFEACEIERLEAAYVQLSRLRVQYSSPLHNPRQHAPVGTFEFIFNYIICEGGQVKSLAEFAPNVTVNKLTF